MRGKQHIRNGLSVDVEDYYHAEVMARAVARSQWDAMASRVVGNTQRILRLFTREQVQATFFVLGWVASRFPGLIREIQAAGHEVGCHSYWHRRVYQLTPDEFRQDVAQAKDAIEQVTGAPVLGFRAPTFSITGRSQWALPILAELGFRYDSSIFPIRHDMYGMPEHSRFRCVHGNGDWKLVELPMSTCSVAGLNLPFAGGGYLRLFPLAYTRFGFNRVNRREGKPVIVYFHPWEFDPEQPRFALKLSSRLRHYRNLDKMEYRVSALLKRYEFVPLCKLLD